MHCGVGAEVSSLTMHIKTKDTQVEEANLRARRDREAEVEFVEPPMRHTFLTKESLLTSALSSRGSTSFLIKAIDIN